MKARLFLLLFLPYLLNAQLILADTTLVCKGQAVKLFVNPKLFSPADFCLDFVGEREGLYYYGSCAQLSFDDAYAFAKIMKGNLATANDAGKNSFIGSRKPGFIKWIGYFQDPNSPKFNEPLDPSSGFVWMSGANVGYTNWAFEEPNNREDIEPGMHVVMGCSNTSPSLWCDENKNGSHKYIAIIESKLKNVPTFPIVKILWETGSTSRSITVSPNISKFYKVQIEIDGEIIKDSIKINVPEVKADLSAAGGCGNPFEWQPKLVSNFPENEMDISWKYGLKDSSLLSLNPKFKIFENGNIELGVKINSLKCNQNVLDSSITFSLKYPFDIANLVEKELKLNEIYTLLPKNINPKFIYKWTPSNGLNNINIASPTFTATKATIYTLEIDDGFGCKTREKFSFTIDPDIKIFIPEVFTPNLDNINDTLEIITNTGFYGQLRRFSIFNNWGQLVHDSKSEWKWDGKQNDRDIPQGLYHYKLNYEIENVPYIKSGSILLLK